MMTTRCLTIVLPPMPRAPTHGPVQNGAISTFLASADVFMTRFNCRFADGMLAPHLQEQFGCRLSHAASPPRTLVPSDYSPGFPDYSPGPRLQSGVRIGLGISCQVAPGSIAQGPRAIGWGTDRPGLIQAGRKGQGRYAAPPAFEVDAVMKSRLPFQPGSPFGALRRWTVTPMGNGAIHSVERQSRRFTTADAHQPPPGGEHRAHGASQHARAPIRHPICDAPLAGLAGRQAVASPQETAPFPGH
jgi:hypothetical protein